MLKQILEATKTVGGVTFYADDYSIARHTVGYWIGGAVPTVTIPESELTLEALKTAIETVSGRTRYVGTWVDNGTVYVDAVSYMRYAESAVELGRKRGEIAVYDIAGNTELMV